MLGENLEYDQNFEILRQNLNDEHRDYHFRKYINNDYLRPIEEIPHPYQDVFTGYASFNNIQSEIIDDALYTDNSLVVSAPTGSGKTAIFEMALIRLLISLEKMKTSDPFKIVYIAPMKALCEERLVDWHKKFGKFGINSISVTGDSDIIEFQRLLNHNLIITTPEKWDCLTRKWRENVKLVEIIKLFMIDEIHLLNEDCRGSVLETIVCRMKSIEETINSQQDDHTNRKIRFIGVSATVPNIEDVAEWIGGSSTAKTYKFSDEYRPVKLNKIVLGYSESQTPFKFDLALNYKLSSLIKQYSHGKPTLIFCSTRKLVEITAKHIMKHLSFTLNPDQKQCLVEAAKRIPDANIREILVHGIGYHHAGMLPETRRAIENLFRNAELPILVTTSTLAMGVNLPAHLVIIKSTKVFTSGGFTDYSEIALSQMIGRAGRPQFDTEATALILTTAKDKEKFEKMIGGLQPIESNLHRHLTEHLNAEVVLQTITDLDVAMRWLSSTFLYIRARKNPRHYGLTSSDPVSIDRRLLGMCQIELNKLIKAGMLTIDTDVLLRATPVGSAMAKYYLAFETMKLFTEVTGGEILQQILALISKCYEFSEMYLRVNDKKCLNLLNNCRNRQTIRFQLNGKIKTLDMKINCIIQAVLGCLDICDHSLLSETLKIMRNGERIVKCLIEYLESKNKCFQALLNTIILAKCFHVKLWENSPYVSKQLAGIGNVMSSQLVNAGKTTFQLLSECDPREIEMIINKKPPTGSKILEQIHHLPKYQLTLELYAKDKIQLTVSLENALDLQQTCTVNRSSLMYLLVGDSENNILLYEKYSHSYFIANPDMARLINFQGNDLPDIEAHLISEDWVGIDCIAKYEAAAKQKSHEKEKDTQVCKKSKNDANATYMQTFMEMYMKCKRNRQSSPKKVKILPKQEESSNFKSSNTNASNHPKIIIHSNVSIIDSNNEEAKSEEHLKRDTGNKIKEILITNTPVKKSEVYTSTQFVAPNDKQKQSLNVNLNYDCGSGYVEKKFTFTPRKFSQKRSVEPDVSHTEQSIKKQNTEEKPKNQMKITWRSPLTYSPPVKFSPNINYRRLNTSTVENECSSVSRASSTSNLTNNEIQEITSKSLTRTPSSLASRTPHKPKIIFPLSDKEVADSSLEETDKWEEFLEKVDDVAAISFLEKTGLISPTQRSQSSHLKTPNEYYHQLLSQSRGRPSVEKREKEPWYKGVKKNIQTAQNLPESLKCGHSTLDSISTMEWSENNLKQECGDQKNSVLDQKKTEKTSTIHCSFSEEKPVKGLGQMENFAKKNTRDETLSNTYSTKSEQLPNMKDSYYTPTQSAVLPKHLQSNRNFMKREIIEENQKQLANKPPTQNSSHRIDGYQAFAQGLNQNYPKKTDIKTSRFHPTDGVNYVKRNVSQENFSQHNFSYDYENQPRETQFRDKLYHGNVQKRPYQCSIRSPYFAYKNETSIDTDLSKTPNLKKFKNQSHSVVQPIGSLVKASDCYENPNRGRNVEQRLIPEKHSFQESQAEDPFNANRGRNVEQRLIPEKRSFQESQAEDPFNPNRGRSVEQRLIPEKRSFQESQAEDPFNPNYSRNVEQRLIPKKHSIQESQAEDPFNDSLGLALEDFSAPFQAEKSILSRRNSVSTADLEDFYSMMGDFEDPFNEAIEELPTVGESVRNSFDISRFEDNVPECSHIVYQNNPTSHYFSQAQHQHNQFPRPPGASSLPLQENIHNRFEPNYNIRYREEPYHPPTIQTFGQYDPFNMSQFRFMENQNSGTSVVYRPQQRNSFDEAEGYKYLRQIMERDHSFIDRNSRSSYLQKEINPFETAQKRETRYSNLQRENFPVNISHFTRSMPPMSYTPQKSKQHPQFYGSRDDYFLTSDVSSHSVYADTDKNYLMHKFLNELNHKPEAYPNFYS